MTDSARERLAAWLVSGEAAAADRGACDVTDESDLLVEVVDRMRYQGYSDSGPKLAAWADAGRRVRLIDGPAVGGTSKGTRLHQRLAAAFRERANASRTPGAPAVPASWAAIGSALRSTDAVAYYWACLTANAVAGGGGIDEALRAWDLLASTKPPTRWVLSCFARCPADGGGRGRFRWWPRSRCEDSAGRMRSGPPTFHTNAAGHDYVIEHSWKGVEETVPQWLALGRAVLANAPDLFARALRAIELAVLPHVPDPRPFEQPPSSLWEWQARAADLQTVDESTLRVIAAEIWQEVRALPGIVGKIQAMGGGLGVDSFIAQRLIAEIERDIEPVEVIHLGRHLRAVN